jgi:N terminus of Rad21 / Rec8 like protein
MQPEVPQALRLQGILMGGVVIIYSRQTHFLLEDCKEVMVRCCSECFADTFCENTQHCYLTSK